MRRLLPLTLIGLAAGIGLGLLVGWALWPVEYTNTSPAELRQDYANDYVLMVAASYWVEGDVQAARDRLALLDADEPSRPLVELTERLIAEGGRPTDIRMLARLADRLGAATAEMAPYLGETQ